MEIEKHRDINQAELQGVEVPDTFSEKVHRYGGAVVAMVRVALTGRYE